MALVCLFFGLTRAVGPVSCRFDGTLMRVCVPKEDLTHLSDDGGRTANALQAGLTRFPLPRINVLNEWQGVRFKKAIVPEFIIPVSDTYWYGTSEIGANVHSISDGSLS